jgi:hypothetical protein
LVVVTDSVEVPPARMLVGLASSVTVGGLITAVTVTAAVAVTVPPAPVAVAVYVVVAVGLTACVPPVALRV